MSERKVIYEGVCKSPDNDGGLCMYSSDTGVSWFVDADYDCYGGTMTRDEAIAAARAILKHFNVGVE